MECIENDIMFSFNPKTMEEVRQKCGFNNREDVDIAIDVLETWVKQQNHFMKKNFKRNFLEKFIIKSKGSLEKAKKRLDKYCTMRTLLPQYFVEYDFENEYKDLDGVLLHCFVPTLTKDNYRIFILKYIGDNISDNHVFHYARNLSLFHEYELVHDYSAGYIFIVDLREIDTLALASKLNLIYIQETITIIFEAYGSTMKNILILSESKMIEVILAVFKQVLSKKLFSRIKVHKNVQELYEYVPKDILPVNYGGNEKSLEQLHDEWQEIFKTEREIAIRMESSNAKTNENLRQSDKFVAEYMGTPGSFRSFTVD